MGNAQIADSAETVFVDGHANGRVHADFFEGVDFAARFDSACGNDGVLGAAAELTEPVEIGAGHGALAVDVGAEKGGAKWFELGHYIFWTQGEFAPPAVDCDAALRGV